MSLQSFILFFTFFSFFPFPWEHVAFMLLGSSGDGTESFHLSPPSSENLLSWWGDRKVHVGSGCDCCGVRFSSPVLMFAPLSV